MNTIRVVRTFIRHDVDEMHMNYTEHYKIIPETPPHCRAVHSDTGYKCHPQDLLDTGTCGP